MKNIYAIVAICLFTTSAIATEIKIIKNKDKKIEVARVAELVKLETLRTKESDGDIQVNVVVEDLGGTTDVSPTQVAYLTVYYKGEMCDVSATFEITRTFGLISATLKEDKYLVKTSEYLDDPIKGEMYFGDVTYEIDATQAIQDVKNAGNCSDFDSPKVSTTAYAKIKSIVR